jgi:uncharacterized membrane protein YdjX (TVP38/TMEM64 family)
VKWVSLFLIAIFAAGLFIVFDIKTQVTSVFENALAWIEGLGSLGALVYVALYIVACILLLPGSALTLGAGAVFGLPLGFALTSIGSTLGATASFVIGRYFARDQVSNKIDGNKTFKAIDDAVAQQGWKIVFLTRLTPALPFNLQNYGYGLTKVKLPHYILASWIGMMPGTVLYVYIGLLTGEAVTGDASAAQWAMRIVALVATVWVTVMITRIAKRALNQAVETEQTA